jgi:type IV secretory pathway VirB6-like protein
MRHWYKQWVVVVVVAVMAMTALPRVAYADDDCDSNKNKPTCTCFKGIEAKIKSGDEYILSEITVKVKEIIVGASQDLFKAFTENAAYESAVYVAATLMIIVYAVSFMFGVVQASFGQVLKKLVTIGIIFTLISPGGWNFFNDYVVSFFNQGVDDLIGGVLEIGTGIPYSPGDSPFVAIDGIAQYVASPDMIVAVLGSTIGGGPYGLAMGAILGASVFGLIKLLIDGLRIYAVTYLLRALLLGLAPVFIVFLFFEKTKGLFASWINALVNQALQPILFFTFLSFFLVLLQTAATDMLGGSELCWTETESVMGTQNKKSTWKFKIKGSNFVDMDESTWQGTLSCKLRGDPDCPEFPINILDLLTFLILVAVATKFGAVVDNIAQDISNATVSLGHDAKMLMHDTSKDNPSPNKNTGGAKHK